MSLKLTSLVVVLLAAPAFATDPATGSVVGKVTQLQVYSNGTLFITIDGGVALCTDALVAWRGFGEAVPSVNGVTVEAYRAWISTLTAAKLSGKKVKIETQAVTVNRNTCLINGISLMD